MKLKRNNGANRSSGVNILRLFNQLFAVGFVVFISMFIYRYMNQPGMPEIDAGDTPQLSANKISVNRNVFDDQDKFIQFYNRISSRDIFESPWEKPQEVVEEVAPEIVPVKIKLPELQTMIRIAGIVLDQGDSQAIIEDLRAGETRFMKIGQEVHEARIVEIREDKVIFIYDDERVELKP